MGLPAFLIASVWFVSEEFVVSSLVMEAVPQAFLHSRYGDGASAKALALNDVRNAVEGLDFHSFSAEIHQAAERYRFLKQVSLALCALVCLTVALFVLWPL